MIYTNSYATKKSQRGMDKDFKTIGWLIPTGTLPLTLTNDREMIPYRGEREDLVGIRHLSTASNIVESFMGTITRIAHII